MRRSRNLSRPFFTSIFSLLILFFVLLTQAPAQQGGVRMGAGRAASPPPVQQEAEPLAPREAFTAGGLLRALNLSPEQRAQIRLLREGNREAARAARRRVGQAYRALNEAIHASVVDEREVEARVQEVGMAHAEVERSRAQTELQIRRVLRPEQLSILRRMRQQARGELLPRQQGDNAAGFSPQRRRR